MTAFVKSPSAFKLMREPEAAEYLQLSISYLRKLRMGKITSSPPITFFKIGRAVRYAREDLDQWLGNQGRYQTTAQVPTPKKYEK